MPFSEGFHGSPKVLDAKHRLRFIPTVIHTQVRKEILQRFSFSQVAARKCRREDDCCSLPN